MIWDWIAYLVAVLGTGISTYYDLKTTYIPDEVTHSMIIIGAALLFLRFDLIHALLYLGMGALVFIIGFVIYSFGQLGGGDVKLYTGLALLIPTFSPILKFEGLVVPPYPPIVSIFFSSALLGMFFISIQYLVKIVKDRDRIPGFKWKITVALLMSLVVLITAGFFFNVERGLSAILIPIAIGIMIYPFKEDILTLYVIEEKEVSKLTEDDIIAIDKLSEDVKRKLGLGLRRTYLDMELKGIIERARKHKIRKVPVYEHLPTFGIYIFLGLIITILVGDLLFFLFSVF